jgi:hypothetical protein
LPRGESLCTHDHRCSSALSPFLLIMG